jgi:hypothetical protein
VRRAGAQPEDEHTETTVDGLICLVRLQTANFRLFLRQQMGQTTNFRLGDEHMVKVLRNIPRFPFSVYCLNVSTFLQFRKRKTATSVGFCKRKMEMANFRFFAAN